MQLTDWLGSLQMQGTDPKMPWRHGCPPPMGSHPQILGSSTWFTSAGVLVETPASLLAPRAAAVVDLWMV